MLLCPWDFPGRILEWVAISFSRESSQHRDWIWISCISCTGSQILYHQATLEAPITQFLFSYVWLFATPWTVAHQASLSFTSSHLKIVMSKQSSSLPGPEQVLNIYMTYVMLIKYSKNQVGPALIPTSWSTGPWILSCCWINTEESTICFSGVEARKARPFSF